MWPFLSAGKKNRLCFRFCLKILWDHLAQRKSAQRRIECNIYHPMLHFWRLKGCPSINMSPVVSLGIWDAASFKYFIGTHCGFWWQRRPSLFRPRGKRETCQLWTMDKHFLAWRDNLMTGLLSELYKKKILFHCYILVK